MTLITISVDKKINDIKTFLDKLKVKNEEKNILFIHDPDKKIAHDIFQTVRYPESFILNPDLTLKRKIIGAAHWRDEAL